MSYDAVIIGSGPISLLEALYRTKKGEKVLVAEASSQLGGAWGTVQHGNFPPLEIGCHIWDIDRETEAFLAKYLKLELGPLKPQPLIVSGRLKVPYDRKKAVFSAREAAGALKKGSIGKAFSAMGKGLWAGGRLSSATYVYPRGGATALTQALLKKLEEVKVEIRTNCRFSQLDLSGSNPQVSLGDEVVETKQTVWTKMSQVPSIVLPGGEKWQVPLSDERGWIHYHLMIEDDRAPNFSYIRLMKHPIIHRLSDITGQLVYHQSAVAGKRYILAGIHESAYAKYSDEERQEGVMSTLKKYGWIGSNASLSEAHYNVYRSRYFGGELMDEVVEKCGNAVQVLPSTNLIYGIRDQLSRWQPVLQP